ncbi:MAG: serine/threonine-protein kinase [bacterium]|nr:serine/threonine-protein kinase [bacterium]
MSVATEALQKGRYRIDSPVAESASSAVYPAYDTTSEAKVYVKEIVVRLGKVTTLSQQENSRLAFENAARRISEFRHDSILQVTDFYSEVGRQYLVLEDVDGSDLHTVLSGKAQQYSLEQALDWADHLLDAVNYLHNQTPQVLHGAVCPKNIKLAASGRIKLLGVTIADESGHHLSTALADVNDGSLNYSPLELIWEGLDAASQKVILSSYDDRSEKILKEAADVRADIYSLGATIYFMLTGRVPVDPLERSIELLEGNRDPLKSPNSIDARVAPEVSDVVMRALEIKRENRFDSAMIMRQVLRTSIVRAKEREATEAQEMNEAAELMKNTQQLKVPAGFEPPAAVETPAVSQPTDAEILAQKLKEAEEMRAEAERKMAEAERMLREQEAERARLEAQAKAIHSSAETAATASQEDDLLGISLEPVRTAPDAIQHDTSDVAEDIHLSIKPSPRAKIDLREIAKKSEPSQPFAIEAPKVTDIEDTFLLETEEERGPKVRDDEPVQTFSFEIDQPKRSSVPMTMIAGVAVAILIAAGLGFVFLGGSSPQPTVSAPNQQTPAQQPEQQAAAPVQTEPQQSQKVNAFTPNAASTVTETPSNEAPATARPVQTAKAKPAAQPAKTPAAKKPVTADDLINDN